MGKKRKVGADEVALKQSGAKKSKAEPAGEKAPAAVVEAGNGAAKDVFRNKEKVLVLCSRGITYRYRHLMTDMLELLPHSKKDVKVESKNNKTTLNELADLKGCTSCLFFECRKKKDLYMWLAKTPSGPSAKFLVAGVHTMDELKLTGNHLKGSRPVLSFSAEFDQLPHLQVTKELLTQIFGTPKEHRKVKPFVDHVFAFSVLDGRIWFRNYQIAVPAPLGKLDKAALEKMTLIEVGPRFVLNPIKMFSNSFAGATLYENPDYVSPNLLRSNEKKAKAGKYVKKVKAKQRRKTHLAANPLQPDELADVWED